MGVSTALSLSGGDESWGESKSESWVCCSVLQCVTVCCSVLQYAAVCCSVLQCVALLGAAKKYLHPYVKWTHE